MKNWPIYVASPVRVYFILSHLFILALCVVNMEIIDQWCRMVIFKYFVWVERNAIYIYIENRFILIWISNLKTQKSFKMQLSNIFYEENKFIFLRQSFFSFILYMDLIQFENIFHFLQPQVFFLCPMKVPKLVRLWWKMILPPLPRHKFQPKMQ